METNTFNNYKNTLTAKYVDNTIMLYDIEKLAILEITDIDNKEFNCDDSVYIDDDNSEMLTYAQKEELCELALKLLDDEVYENKLAIKDNYSVASEQGMYGLGC